MSGAWRPVALIGPAFVGKTSLVRYLTEHAAFHQIPTVTTRPPRPVESDGSARRFLSAAEFTATCVGPEWVVTMAGSVHYAINVADVRAAAARGPVVFESSLEGLSSYRAVLPDVAVTYLRPSDRARLDDALAHSPDRPPGERAARVIANREWVDAEPAADLCLTVPRLGRAQLAEFHRTAAARMLALARGPDDR
jgi:guanylate kinase